MTSTPLPSNRKAEPKAGPDGPRTIRDDRLEQVSGGAGRRIIIVGG